MVCITMDLSFNAADGFWAYIHMLRDAHQMFPLVCDWDVYECTLSIEPKVQIHITRNKIFSIDARRHLEKKESVHRG